MSEAVRFVQADGTVWERSGECCRCGECCKGDPFNGELGEAPVCDYCPLFRWLQDGRGSCSDRKHPYYLSGCVDYPTRPEQITDKPSCSYTFARVG